MDHRIDRDSNKSSAVVAVGTARETQLTGSTPKEIRCQVSLVMW